MSESVIVVDFGGQYNQLIARRVRECHVYSEIVPYTKALDVIKAKRPRGIIFTGGPNSAYEDGAPAISTEVFDLGIPVLGICYGAQLMMHLLGGHVCKAPVREYGKTEVFVDPASKLFADISSSTVCWMSHTDYIESVAPGFVICTQCKLPGRGDGAAGKASVCAAVSSRGPAHAGGYKDALEFHL